MEIELVTKADTLGYLQVAATFSTAFAIILAAIIGSSKVNDYLNQKKATHKYDIAVMAYGHCRKAAGILLSFKSSDLYTRKFIDQTKSSPKVFIVLFKNYSEFSLTRLNEHKDFFLKSHEIAFESRLLFGEEGEKPLSLMISTYNDLNRVLNGILEACKMGLDKDDELRLTPYGTNEVISIIEKGLVQIFENIETSKEQEDYIKKQLSDFVQEHEDKNEETKKAARKATMSFKYMEKNIYEAMALAEKTYTSVVR